MIRLIQYKILEHQGKDTKNTDGWESGLTAEKIQDALCAWQADALPGGYFRTTKPTQNLRLILDAFSVEPAPPIVTTTLLRRLKHSFDTASTM